MRTLAAMALLLAGCTSSGFNRPVELQQTSEVLTDCGVRYVDLRTGDGTPAVIGAVVSLHYVGFVENGVTFDSTHDRGVPMEFVVGSGEVLEGWEQGMLGMRVGGLRRIVIPPDCGFGDEGRGDIPPDATLVLEVELLEVRAVGA